jgi:hypothetical protein
MSREQEVLEIERQYAEALQHIQDALQTARVTSCVS